MWAFLSIIKVENSGADLGGARVQGVRTPPTPEMTCGFLIQLVFYILV